MLFIFFNDTATTEIYTLSLHDALPIFTCRAPSRSRGGCPRPSTGSPRLGVTRWSGTWTTWKDRKSTRLNSSHANISYAVFCLKKKTDTSKLALTQPHSDYGDTQ